MAKIIEDWSAVAAFETEAAQRREQDRAVDAETHKARMQAHAADREALAAQSQADHARAVGERRLKTGIALLAGGVGLGVVVAAASLWRKPEIVTVEVPKPFIVERSVEKITRVPVEAPAPAPPIGARATEEQFKESQEFRDSDFSGRIVSHIAGRILFDNGRERWDAFPNGTRDTRVTTDRNNGDWAFCHERVEKFPDGSSQWECRALHQGRVEPIFGPGVPRPLDR